MAKTLYRPSPPQGLELSPVLNLDAAEKAAEWLRENMGIPATARWVHDKSLAGQIRYSKLVGRRWYSSLKPYNFVMDQSKVGGNRWPSAQAVAPNYSTTSPPSRTHVHWILLRAHKYRPSCGLRTSCGTHGRTRTPSGPRSSTRRSASRRRSGPTLPRTSTVDAPPEAICATTPPTRSTTPMTRQNTASSACGWSGTTTNLSHVAQPIAEHLRACGDFPTKRRYNPDSFVGRRRGRPAQQHPDTE